MPIPIGVILAVGTAVAIASFFVFEGEKAWVTQYIVPLLIFLLVLVAVLQYLVVPWQARRHYMQSAGLKDEVTVEWDAQGIRLRGSRGESNLAWDDYYRWTEGRSLLLLHISEQMFHTIPESALTAEQWDDFRANIAASGLKKG
ncbi:YcxB family protein [Erythrobacter alti]|uniref:YcxB family protein n=1 Tax=Erythrobacter alti TaxID=1896145 RepID=UPI0030F430C6